MQDTTPEFRRLMLERLLRLAPHERVRLCTEMFETARQLIEASLPQGLDPVARRRRVAERLYGELARRAFAGVSGGDPDALGVDAASRNPGSSPGTTG